jgi:hypothetical protein
MNGEKLAICMQKLLKCLYLGSRTLGSMGDKELEFAEDIGLPTELGAKAKEIVTHECSHCA